MFKASNIMKHIGNYGAHYTDSTMDLLPPLYNIVTTTPDLFTEKTPLYLARSLGDLKKEMAKFSEYFAIMSDMPEDYKVKRVQLVEAMEALNRAASLMERAQNTYGVAFQSIRSHYAEVHHATKSASYKVAQNGMFDPNEDIAVKVMIDGLLENPEMARRAKTYKEQTGEDIIARIYKIKGLSIAKNLFHSALGYPNMPWRPKNTKPSASQEPIKKEIPVEKLEDSEPGKSEYVGKSFAPWTEKDTQEYLRIKRHLDKYSKAIEELRGEFERDFEKIKEMVVTVKYASVTIHDDLEKIAKFADFLDERGAHALAEKTDEVAKLLKLIGGE